MAIRWIFLVTLGACVLPFLIGSARAEANVGCIFSEQLCEAFEWCYNDNAFGRCLPAYGHINDDDLYRYQLEREALRLIETEMRRLFTQGYRWSHAYTQCIIQNLLLSQRFGLSYDRSPCIEEENTDLDRALQLLEAGEEIAAQDLATVHFSPSKLNGHSDYADELFIPPLEPNMPQTPAFFGIQTHFPKDETPTVLSVPATHSGGRKSKRVGPRKNHLSDNQLLALLSLLYPNEDDLKIGDGIVPDKHLMRDYGDALLNDLSPQDLEQLQGLLESSNAHQQAAGVDEDSSYNPEDRQMALDYDMANGNWDSDASNRWDIGFKRLHRYDVKKPGPNFMANLDDFDSTEAVVNEQLHQASLFKLLDEAQQKQQEKESQILDQQLTAEGMQQLDTAEQAQVPENATDGAVESQKRVPAAPAALAREEAALESLAHAQMNEDTDSGEEDAKRRINLEVPEALDQYMITGPRRDDAEDVIQELYKLQRTNSFKKAEPIMFRESPESEEGFGSFGDREDKVKNYHPKITGEEFSMRQPSTISRHHHQPLSPPHDTHTTINDKRLLNSPKKLISPDQVNQFSQEEPIPTGNQFDVVDTTYAYLSVEGGFESWKEAKDLLEKLAKLLDVEPNIFSNIRVEGDQVTFKVNSNPQGLNASTVASKAESYKSTIKEETGKVVTSVGIGDKTKISVQSLEDDKKFFIITFVVCGCIAGVLIAVAVVYVIRRHARSKEKLQNLAQPETEASQDYQDLCRQRMANKSNEKPEPIHVAQRVTSLSRESETSVRSPSSRSSTSSWSEEPVTSNMDISTGHMVLSYMEDHLKNKDRLDQEWVALCAYEADPCNVSAATQPANMKKNRYADVLPFDHSRVVLNDLTNIAGSDYINASSITDHDPRNPAYITTQGPLPQTSADFWQMIWEQGSVVIVMLTRLVENGVAMCHRYWPEEGSELYHIYEVHLVSEHIWCDDYLVRSFYLKNLKTGETRTVTQFHFLSWPDNGVPTSTKALLDFRRKVNKSYRGRSCPIVVHCSDGSGRSGTYCLIDMVLNRMAKGAKEIDIAATLEHIRDQRTMMVKTKAQFEFALMSVAEEVHAILKAIPQ